MFSVATIFLVAFALNLQDAVYGSVTVTAVVTSSSSSTTPANNSGPMATMSSPMPTLSAIVPTPAAAASTSGTSSETTSKTSSETPSTTGTTSSSSATTEKPTSTQSGKTCASVTATLKEAKQKENVTEILSRFLVSESKKYSDISITKLDVSGKKVSFTVCVKIGTGGKIESDTERHLQQLLNATEVEINILGVKITDWEAVDGECKKCTDGGGGPYQIKRKCDEEKHSCNGVEDTKEEKDCSKYCSGASFMASYLLVSMGIALSLSFYL